MGSYRKQQFFKALVGGLVCFLVALNFQNCAGNKESSDSNIDPLSLEAVVVREKTGGAIVSGANPVRVGKSYLFGLMSPDVPDDMSLDVNIVSSTTAVCTLGRLAESQVIYEGSCAMPGKLVLELVLSRPDKADAITSVTLEVLDATALGADLVEFEFTGPSGNLIAFEEYRLNYTYKNTTPFFTPKFTTLPASQIRCTQIAHPLGTYRFLCDRPGVWVVQGEQEGSSFAKVKSFEVVMPSSVTPYFFVEVNGASSKQKLNLLTNALPKASGSYNTTLKFYRPSGVANDVVFDFQVKSQSGTMCTSTGAASGSYIRTLICSGAGQVVITVTVKWPGGVQRTGNHTLKFQ